VEIGLPKCVHFHVIRSKTLHETGLDENTMVVFTADHGEMLGERGMWFKQCFYEWSVRVPLAFHFPQQFASRRVSELVSLVDLLPTFMDLASAGHPPEPVSPLDGASLVSLAQGRSVGWRDHVISEYTGEGVVAPCRMVRRGPYKYIYTHGYPPLLYDLQADPSECNNLADQSRFADLVADLQAIVLDDWAPEVIHAQCIQSQKERLFIQQTTGGEPNWAFRYRPDDGARYIRNAGAVETKAKSRYPFVEPTPFER
ncbi:sulfatase/phosphatase domain-containing protein, partial [Candidatus Entotheonella palauensis]|uniref:sulfatase/phosphatase domain-containing protein n=1 Tax=Candidatus Entotheonella palauensis TaxID=93172 RepID=UPI0011788323